MWGRKERKQGWEKKCPRPRLRLRARPQTRPRPRPQAAAPPPAARSRHSAAACTGRAPRRLSPAGAPASRPPALPPRLSRFGRGSRVVFSGGASRRWARAVPLPRGAGSRGPRSRPPLAWPGPEAAPHGLGLARGAGSGARSDMGKKHKKHKSDRHFYEGEERPACPLSRAAPARKAPARRDAPAGRRSTRACRPRRVFVGRWEVGRPPSVCPASAHVLLLFQSTWRSP